MINGTSAFGSTHHPATLLREIRIHADDVAWWQGQIDEATDDLTRAEWALALWAVATTKVLDELVPTWELTVNTLPPNRRWALDESVTLLNYSGMLRPRPINATSSTSATERFFAAREAGRRLRGGAAFPSSDPPPPLAITAREANWLLVDQTAQERYR